MIGVQTGDGASLRSAAMLDSPPAGFVGLIMCSANLPDKIAIAVDTQMDDGVAASGTVRALLQTAPNPAIGAAAGSDRDVRGNRQQRLHALPPAVSA